MNTLSQVADISIVIPAAGAPAVFAECLSSVFRNTRKPAEVILVDDAMDAAAHEIADRFPVRVMKNPGKGVSAARNFGASLAEASVILFMDTDVVLKSDALETIENGFNDPDVDAAVGIQSADFRFRDFFSRYKNHWMRFTYHRLTEPISLFYTSCAAIRRKVFMSTDGFDENYRMPSIEDTVFGAELGKRNVRVRLLKSFEIEHVKAYSLQNVLKTDFFRSSALLRYVLRNWRKRSRGGIRKTSVPMAFILGALTMAGAIISAGLSPWIGWPGVTLFLGGCILTDVLNHEWLIYLKREEGIKRMMAACLFMPLDVTFVVAGMGAGVVGFIMGNRY